jgi:hypothetical protein
LGSGDRRFESFLADIETPVCINTGDSFNKPEFPKLMYTIYKVTNKINNKFYIGKHQTKKLDDGYMGSGKLIKAAIKKYGIENFSKEIMYVFDSEAEMNQKEKELVVLSEMSYNLCEGGFGGFGYINTNGLNIDLKQQEMRNSGLLKEASRKGHAKKRILASEDTEYAKKLYAISISALSKARDAYPKGPMFGRKHTETTIQKMSQSHKGKQTGSKNSQYGTIWVNNEYGVKKIKKEDLNEYITLGYRMGRKTPN